MHGSVDNLVPLDLLRAGVAGPVTGPRDPGYDDARRVYYSGFDRRPAAVVRALDDADVARVIGFAREHGLELAVRSGGHSVAGHGTTEGGLVLDLSALNAISVDPQSRTAWAQAGATAGAYTKAAGAHGLATGFGDAASVGIGGSTLAGGVGFLHRLHGLTIDSLIAAEIVTAAGDLLRIDEASHPDLFWAIRGGGGNFGVVTRLRFRLHPVDRVTGGMLMLPASPALLARVIAHAEAAPDTLSGLVNVMPVPALPYFPDSLHGRMVVMAALVHAGPRAEADAVFAPFRALADPIADEIRPLRYRDVYDEPAEAPQPLRMSLRSFFMDAVDEAAAAGVLDALARSSAAMRVAQFRVLGGAVARVPATATAFAHRQRRLMVTIGAGYEDAAQAPAHDDWAQRAADALSDGEPAAYVGFLGDEGEARVRAAYPPAVRDRLRQVKRRYDPDNLFRLNHNIPPADD